MPGKSKEGRPIAAKSWPSGKGGAGQVAPDPCERERLVTVDLSVPAANLKAGDHVGLEAGDGEIFCITARGPVGTLTTASASDFIECLRRGYVFSGSIERIEGLVLTARVRGHP